MRTLKYGALFSIFFLFFLHVEESLSQNNNSDKMQQMVDLAIAKIIKDPNNNKEILDLVKNILLEADNYFKAKDSKNAGVSIFGAGILIQVGILTNEKLYKLSNKEGYLKWANQYNLLKKSLKHSKIPLKTMEEIYDQGNIYFNNSVIIR